MPARAKRYIGILLAVGSLAIPIDINSSTQVQANPRPFLDTAAAQSIAERQFAVIQSPLPGIADIGPEGAFAAEGPFAAKRDFTATGGASTTEGASTASGASRKSAAAAAGKSPALRAARPRPQAKVQPSVTVTVRDGQTVWSLAAQYGTSVEAIVAANNLRSATLIRTGQRLVIPRNAAAATRRPAARTRTVTVRLAAGQTLWDLSRAYGVSVEEIAAANQLASPDRVRAGQRLQVPARTVAVSRRVAVGGVNRDGVSATRAVRLVQAFIWPARGRLTSRFGWRARRHHDGIDIAAPRGAPIAAARDGVVVFVGWYYGYGKTVIINHGGGLQTIYGHASALLVRAGQRVSRGQLIARVGSTGRSTGPHVHFEVRINGRPVNPMKYL